jgi:HK97 gp10 family phage protein
MATIKGLPELMKALDDSEKKTDKNQSIALRLIAQEYENDAKAITPWITHTLLHSIHIEPTSGTFQQGKGAQYVVVGTNVEYARRVEYGFVGKDKLGRSYHQAPKPYIRAAMDQHREKYKTMFLEKMTE